MKQHRIALALLTVTLVTFLYRARLEAQSCTTSSVTVSENFKTTVNEDLTTTSIQGWGGLVGVKLNYKAGAFPAPNPSNWAFGERVYGVATGDFLGDGNNEIVVMGLNTAGSCSLDFFTPTSVTVAPTKKGNIDTCPNGAFVGTTITAGDVNGDGKMDFIYAYNTSPTMAGAVAGAKLYVNTGSSGGMPTFSSQDITSLFTNASVAWHTNGGSPIAFADWNGDGLADLLSLSSSGTTNVVYEWPASGAASPGFLTSPTTLVSNIGLVTPIASSTQQATGGFACDGAVAVSKGGTGLAVADLNNDSLPDLFITSVSETNAYRYFQNADGSVTRGTNVSGFAANLLFADDVDNNGVPDIIAIPSGNDCSSTGGYQPPTIWLKLYNVSGTTDRIFALQMPGGTIQYGGLLDLNRDGTADIIAGKLTANGNTVVYGNTPLTTAYALTGQAQTKTLSSALDGNKYGIVAVTASMTTTAASGGNVTLYVTNNGGQTWDALTATELAGTAHNFSYFGSDLRFKAVFSETSYNYTTTPGTYYVPAANVSPILTNVSLSYSYVPQGVYSRSALSGGNVITGSGLKQYIYSAAFQYPGFTGYLYAYDTTNLPPGTAGNGNLQQVSGNANLGVSTGWEAGQVLAGTSAASRKIYTAYPVKYFPGPGFSNTTVDGILPFSTAQITSPTTNPNLVTMMGLNNSTASSILNFIISGMGNPNNTKFYDPGHSSPVFVGPAQAAGNANDSNYMGSGYAAFTTSVASRIPIVLMGANDGMLHAFRADTGAEAWAFVPNNLLSHIAQQVGINPNSNAMYYKHQSYVDGTVQVSDIVTAGNVWKTIAVVGEGQGVGTQGNHFYFAVDITDTLNPIPLWEFSDIANATPTVCDGNPCLYQCTTTCVNSGIQTANTPGDSYFQVSTSGAVEAENFDTVLNATGTNDLYTTLTTGSPASGASGNTYMQPIGSSTPCPTGSASAASLCTQLTYRFNNTTFATNFYPWFRTYTSSSSIRSFAWGIDGGLNQTMTTSAALNGWVWVAGSAAYLSQGDHTLTVYMNQTTFNIDQIGFTLSSVSPPSALPTSAAGTTPMFEQYFVCGSPACANNCVSDPNNQEWPECGVGSGNKCCQFSATQYFCSPASQACSAPSTTMGQTWSKPAIGRMAWTGGTQGKWVAWFGSGYNDRTMFNVGRTVYGIDAYTGNPIGSWTANDVTYSAANPNIENTIPGSPALADVDNDGYIDRVYIGDLVGRLWKINTQPAVSLDGNSAMSNPNVYKMCVAFDAGNPNQTGGTRQWAPIITRPATAVLSPNTVNVYFGTGGDERAPSTLLYRFYSVRDLDAITACATTPRAATAFSTANLEWIVGDGMTNYAPVGVLANPNAEGTLGDRYWADPIIVNGDEIYFASLPGNIESVNPCLDLQGSSKVFAYAIQSFSDFGSGPHAAGSSLLSGGAPYLISSGKIRQAAFQFNSTGVPTHGGTSIAGPGVKPADVFIQSFSGTGGGAPTVSRISSLGTKQASSPLRVLRWREVPL